jgi:hypothetical protein
MVVKRIKHAGAAAPMAVDNNDASNREKIIIHHQQ